MQYNLNRLAQNLHEMGDKTQKAVSECEAQQREDVAAINARREADLAHASTLRDGDRKDLDDKYGPLLSRMSAAEARAAVFGAVAGLIASGFLAAVWAMIFKH